MLIKDRFMSRGTLSQRLIALASFLVPLGLVVSALKHQFLRFWSQRWAQDDAYISFRYARNLIEGHGLVYNIGEYVEGYTNFLWTLLSAFGLLLGLDDPIGWIHSISAVAWFAVYLLLIGIGWRLHQEAVWLTILVLIPLGNHWSFNMWFFSGMEVPLVTLLVVAGVVQIALAGTSRRDDAILAGLSCALILLRADSPVYIGGFVLAKFLADSGYRNLRRWVSCQAAWIVPVVLCVALHSSWRLWYYGDLLPNTFYAKTIYSPHYARGVEYLYNYFDVFDVLWWLPLLPVGLCLTLPQLLRRFVVATSAVSLIFCTYLIRIGGDFMEWRFLIPCTPLIYMSLVSVGSVVAKNLLFALHHRLLPRRVTPTLLASSAGALGSLVVVFALYRGTESIWQKGCRQVAGQEDIGSLRKYCARDGMDWPKIGKALDTILPRSVRIAIGGAGAIPYFLKDRYVVDLHGLTNRSIAREPLSDDSTARIGHEHEIRDYRRLADLGADIFIPFPLISPFPNARVMPPHADVPLNIQVFPGRWITAVGLRPEKLEALRSNPFFAFYDRENRYSPRLPYIFKTHDKVLISSLDWQNLADQRLHRFSVIAENKDSAPEWHRKILAYRISNWSIIFADDGMRLCNAAEWYFSAPAARDTFVVLRHDSVVSTSLKIVLNDQPLDSLLEVRWSPDESWDEGSALLPADFVRTGVNKIRLTSIDGGCPEIYYTWFYQSAN